MNIPWREGPVGAAAARRPLAVLALLLAAAFLLLSLSSCGGKDLLLPIDSNQGFGYIDGNGKVVISPRYQWADNFSEGLARVTVDGRMGFIDASGNLVIEPQYAWVGSFKEQLAVAEVEGRYGYIDEAGYVAIAPRFDRADAFTGGLAVVVSEGKYGYVDTSGNTVIEPRFDWSGRFSEGLALTLEGTTYGYVDRSGELVINLPPPAGLPQSTGEGVEDALDIEQWQSLLSYCAFSDGLALLEKDGKFGYIDTSGKTSIEPSFDSAKSFSEGLAAVRSGRKWGFVNTSGETVIEPGLDQVESFSEGMAPYKNRGVWGYINTSGNISINAQYDYAAGFSAGLAPVEVGSARGYIDKQGGYVWKPSGPDTDLGITRPSKLPLIIIDVALAFCILALAVGMVNYYRMLVMLKRGEGQQAVDVFLERYHSSERMRKIKKGPFVLDEHLEKLLKNNRVFIAADLVFLVVLWVPNLLYITFAGRGIFNYYIFHKNGFLGDDWVYNALGTATLLMFLAFCFMQRSLLEKLLAYLKGAGPDEEAGEE
jgi:hypothetical protein